MYDRLELLIGDKVRELKEKAVLLLGLGGVGGYSFESLLRSGIGTIIVVDNDRFEESNLNRQLLSNLNNIGNYKVDEALKRKEIINPECQVIKIKEFITKDNIDMLFKYKIDFVIDAIDNVDIKKLIIKNCLEKKIKFISVMGTGNKLDSARLEIMDIRKTMYDPLAKIIRKYVNSEHLKGKVPVVSSFEKPIKNEKVGSNAFVPAVAGLLAANYAVLELLRGNL